MSLEIPKSLLDEVEELISHYPQKRSASLMLLHAFQEHFGHVSKESVEWIAAKLDLRPINVYELVTFYPMFREEPAGRHVIKVCRTLSCALGEWKITWSSLPETGARPQSSWPANQHGRKIFRGICGVSGQLRDGSCDDVQRRFPRGRQR